MIDPQPGERVLDVGTGSGGIALLAARAGANVTGVDVAADGIERARSRARDEGLDVTFDVGDAQSLPYDDASFDVVLSGFGVIFSSDQRRGAAELARVCRPGGRLGLTLMPRDSRTAATFDVLREFWNPGVDHPGDFSVRLDELLGDAFEFEAQRREAEAREPGGDQFDWDRSVEEFGPLREVVSHLDDERVTALRERLEALSANWSTVPASYILVAGRRR